MRPNLVEDLSKDTIRKTLEKLLKAPFSHLTDLTHVCEGGNNFFHNSIVFVAFHSFFCLLETLLSANGLLHRSKYTLLHLNLMSLFGLRLKLLLLTFLMKLMSPHSEVPITHMLCNELCLLTGLI